MGSAVACEGAVGSAKKGRSSPAALAGWAVAWAAATLVGCGPSASEERELVVTGSSTLAPLVSDMARRFEARHDGIRLSVQAGGSSRGIADTRRGTADIGMVSRGLTDAERATYGLEAHPVALDGLCLIVHRDNLVESVTHAEVRKIYTGELTRWQALGGDAADIVVVNKAAGRGTRSVFLDHYALAGSEVDADVVIGHNEEAVKTVTGSPHAIAYVSIGAAEYHRDAGAAIRILRLDGVRPSSEKLRKEQVPIRRTLNLVTRGEPTRLARRFIDFAQSKEVHDIVEAHYFVPAEP